MKTRNNMQRNLETSKKLQIRIVRFLEKEYANSGSVQDAINCVLMAATNVACVMYQTATKADELTCRNYTGAALRDFGNLLIENTTKEQEQADEQPTEQP